MTGCALPGQKDLLASRSIAILETLRFRLVERSDGSGQDPSRHTGKDAGSKE
jgi:hypothetical protein